jgi:hypothetical protein
MTFLLALLGGWRGLVLAVGITVLVAMSGGLALSRSHLQDDLTSASQRIDSLVAAQTETLASLAQARSDQQRAESALAGASNRAATLAARTALQHQEIRHVDPKAHTHAADPVLAAAVDGLFEPLANATR